MESNVDVLLEVRAGVLGEGLGEGFGGVWGFLRGGFRIWGFGVWGSGGQGKGSACVPVITK